MVRFFCFLVHFPSTKPKKSFQPSAEAMDKSPQVSSEKQAINLEDLSRETSLKPSQAEGTSKSLKPLLSLQPIRKSGDNESSDIDESSLSITQTRRIVKSRSVGSALNLEGRFYVNSDSENETDRGESDGSNEHNSYEVPSGSRGTSPPEQRQSSEVVNDGSIFSIGDRSHSEQETQENSETVLSGEFGYSGVRIPRTEQGLVKSHSLPSFSDSSPASNDHTHFNHLAVHSSRSSEDLRMLCVRRKEISVNELGMQAMEEHKNDDIIARPENSSAENSVDDGFDYTNLSKNNIANIEGLRKLTRLRVLDLSYNRILRIGHGLASCSSLKELYLAGNKISEVEGLHRLLKLAVLDLQFNKISTAKCLGQLAANYNSLQAISLEGNPAQKNVGDEHVKKYLQGLLPRLAYYNRQPIKSSTLKDAADRSVRVGSTHQFERGLRPDRKAIRKGTSHGASASSHRLSSSSTHGTSTRGHASRSVLSHKKSRGRHGGHLPPSGTTPKVSHTRHRYFDKLMSLKQHLSLRRVRSKGTMAGVRG